MSVELRATVEVVIRMDSEGPMLDHEIAQTMKAAEQQGREVSRAIEEALRINLSAGPGFYAPDDRECFLGELLSADVQKWELA